MRWTIGQWRSRLVGLGFAIAVLITLNDLPSMSAGELDPARVPADAQWLVHIDYESLSDSAMWQKIRDEKPLVSKMIQGRMKKRFGIDPTTDLKSITMFSRDYQAYTGTAIVAAMDDVFARMETWKPFIMKHRQRSGN